MSYIQYVLLFALFVYFVWEMKHSLHRSAVTNELIQKYADKPSQAQQEELIAAIYDYCVHDRKLKKIIKKYAATEDDIRRLYKKLLRWGDFQKRRRYVPISSFFYVYTLEYLLKHPEAEDKELTQKCMNFLHI